MADVANSFDGGTVGAGITAAGSGAGSGTAFGFVGIVAGGSATYTDVSYRGPLAGRFASGPTAGTCLAEYSTALGAQSSGELHGRLRFQLPSLPPDSGGVRVAVIADSTGAFRAELRVTNSGAVSIRGPAGTALATFTDPYVAGTWWDVGLSITVFSSTAGVIEGRKHDASGAVSQTLVSTASQNTLGAGGTNKCQIGMIRSMANFAVLVDDVAWSTSAYPSLPVSGTPAIRYGPWSGAVTDTSVTVTYVLAGTTTARLAIATDAALSAPTFSAAAAPDPDGVVKLTVTGLTPSTLYHYGVAPNDGPVLPGGRGQVTTFPPAHRPADFSLAFGSCQFNTPSDTTFAAILARSGPAGRALQLIHMGDLHYQDWDAGTTREQVYTQYMASLSSTSMAPLLAAVPINHLWDNHDWGGDDSDRTAPAGDVVAATYRQVFATYPLEASDGRGGYHSWVIGRIRMIQLDTRSYRDPQSGTETGTKTMLGLEQKQWLKDLLTGPEPVKIICGQYPWRDDGDGSGRWGSYSAEFAELADYLNATVPGRVYVIFGDRHYLAADDGTSVESRGVPQAGGAPFQQTSVQVGGAWSHGSYTIAPAVMQAFGWLDVTDTGTQITINYQGITSLDGASRVTMTTVFDTDTGDTSASSTDTLTLADRAGSTVVLNSATAQGLQLESSAGQTSARARAVADELPLTASQPQRRTVLVTAATDTVAVADAVTRPAAATSRTVAEPVALLDAAVRSGLACLRDTADVLSLHDAAQATLLGVITTTADTITLTATAGWSITRPAAATDQLALTGAATGVVALARTVTAALTVADVPLASTLHRVSAADTITLAASRDRAVSRSRAVPQAMALSDVAVRGAVALVRTVADLLALDDAAAARRAVAPWTVVDQIAVADAPVRALLVSRDTLEALVLLDAAGYGPPGPRPPIPHVHHVQMSVNATIVVYTAGP